MMEGKIMFGETVNNREEADKLLRTLKQIDKGEATSDSISAVRNIKKVVFAGMEFSEIPNSISILSNLEELELQFNKIKTLPNSIGCLSKLRLLDLHNNQLIFLPKEIGNLLELKTFNCDWNEIEELPNQIGNLKNLETMSLIGNHLRTVPSTLGDLVSLKILDIQTNKIVSLPNSMKELQALETLDLSENPLNYLPEFLFELKSLKRLGIGRMRFHHFPKTILDLNLPFKHNTLFDISNPEGIYMFGTELATQPVSLFLQNRSLIEEYFQAEKTTLQEAKVIFLGDGSVGKTYTIKRLLYGGRIETSSNADEYTTSETHGIIISNYKTVDTNIETKLWDFGGQEILHSIHRCFLTEHSCYIVMVSTRTPDPMGRARYWLKCIQSFAPNSSVILIINRFSNFGCNGLNEVKLKTEFPQLQKVRYFSVKTSSQEEFMLLKKDIDEIVSKLDGTGMEFPVKWELIRKKIVEEAEINKKFYITNKEYFEICDMCGMTETNSITPYGDMRIWLLDWFNDLGNCFSNHRGGKREFTVLNPEWLTNALYLIVYNGGVFTDTGVLPHKFIQMILKHPEDGESGKVPFLENVVYGEKECEYVLEIMREFQISYAESEKSEFIPTLASDIRPSDSELIPKEWDKNNSTHKYLSYRLKYKYLPDIVFHKLMIICRSVLKWSPFPWWKGGMRIDNVPFKLTAIVEIEPNDELKIDVYAYGIEPPWKLLQPLNQLVLDINEKMNLYAEEFIEVYGSGQKDVFKVEWLIKQRNKGKEEVSGEDDDYKIDDLLGIAYGIDNLKQATKDAQIDNVPLEIAGLNFATENATINNFYLYNYEGSSVQLNINKYLQSGFSQEELLKYLQLLPEREQQVPEAFLDQLASMLQEQAKEYAEFQQAAFIRLADQINEKNAPKKKRLEKLRDWIGDAANIVTLTPVIMGAAPTLCEFLQKTMPELIRNFNSMIQMLKYIN